MSNVPAYPKTRSLAQTAPAANSNPQVRPVPRREPLAPMKARPPVMPDAAVEVEAALRRANRRLGEIVQAAPVSTMVGAAALGILLGRLLRR